MRRIKVNTVNYPEGIIVIPFGINQYFLYDPNVLIKSDKCMQEERWDAIGVIDNCVFVAFVQRYENTIRIIPARKATK